MTLALIGLGLYSEKDLSLNGIEELKKSDKVYMELYTGKWQGSMENLKKLIGKEIVTLERKDLEENSRRIISESKKQNVSILVQGDPLIATMHSSLISEAKKLGIETKIVHNSSIVSAIAETGLHVYKIGQVVTIPFPEKTKGKKPKSTFNSIKENKKRDLHTLCLLDIVTEEGKYMTINEGVDILLSWKIISKTDKIVVFAKAGSTQPVILYKTAEEMIKKKIKDTPAVIIIPGKLHFTEKEYLEMCKNG